MQNDFIFTVSCQSLLTLTVFIIYLCVTMWKVSFKYIITYLSCMHDCRATDLQQTHDIYFSVVSSSYMCRERCDHLKKKSDMLTRSSHDKTVWLYPRQNIVRSNVTKALPKIGTLLFEIRKTLPLSCRQRHESVWQPCKREGIVKMRSRRSLFAFAW